MTPIYYQHGVLDCQLLLGLLKLKMEIVNMSNEKMREEFKDWHDKQTGLDVKYDEYGTAYCSKDMTTKNMFINSVSNAMWQAWQASRAALCVELPKQWFDDDLECDLMVANRVLDALDEAGVRYK